MVRYFHPIILMAAQSVRSFHLRLASSRAASTVGRTFSWRLLSTSENDTDALKAEDEGLGTSTQEKKRLVFLGTPDVAATTLRKLHEDSISQTNSNAKYEIVCVITQPPKRRRRKGSKAEPSAVGAVAEELGLRVLSPEKAKDPEFLDILEQDIKPDLCITAAYGQYLPKRFLAAPTLGTVNIHPSLLPRWRGASPVQRSLEAGDNPVGVSVLYTVSKMDAGPIIAQKEETIADENAGDLLPLLFDIGTNLLLQNIPDILSGAISIKTAHIYIYIYVYVLLLLTPMVMHPWMEIGRAHV